MRLREYPGFLPGLALTLLVSFALASRLGRTLGVRHSLAWGLLFGFGLIASATLTPGGEALRFGHPGSGSCDLARLGFASVSETLRLGETGLNVVLFIPLGLAVGLLPRIRLQAWLAMGAMALPFVIEATQLVLTPLGRQCQSADVIDNLTGLVIGFAIGWLGHAVLDRHPSDG